MTLKATLDRLRGDAERVATGRFRVDSARALAKLRDFRLTEPHHYVLEVLRAAVVSGAAAASLRCDADDVEIEFDGDPFPADALPELFGCALAGGADRDALRLRLLAFGVLGALALRPRFVDVHTGTRRVHVVPPDHLEVSPAPARRGTRVHLKHRGLHVLRNVLLVPPEREKVPPALPQFPIPFSLQGRPTSRERPGLFGEEPPPWAWAAAGSREASRHVQVTVRRDAAAGDQGIVHLSVHGVLVATRVMPVSPLPIEAWIDDPRLRRNASGSDVVQDDAALTAAVGEACALARRLLAQLVVRLRTAPDPDLRFLLTRAASVAGCGAGEELAAFAEERRTLGRAPLLPGPSGEWVSIAEIQRELSAGRPIARARQAYPRDLYDPPVVLMDLTPEQKLVLPEGPQKDIHSVVQARSRQRRNRMLFEAQPEEPARLGAGPFAARATFEEGGFTGEVGLPVKAERSTVRFLKGRRLLREKDVSFGPMRVAAVVDGDALSLDASWSALAEDDAYDAAVAVVRGAAERALLDALGAGGEPSDALRAHARDLVAARAGRRERLPDLLEAAPIYPLAGGGFASLDTMRRSARCRYVNRPWPVAALDGEPVVVLPGRDRTPVAAFLGARPLREYTEEMRRQLEVRERLAAPRQAAKVPGEALARTSVAGEGLQGEAVLRSGGSTQLELTLLREGVRLEVEVIPARYGPTVAAVECAALTPRSGWDGAERDPVHARVLAAVRAAETALLGGLLDEDPARPLSVRHPVAAEALRTFLRRDVPRDWMKQPDPDVLQRRVLDAPLFDTLAGTASAAQVVAAARAAGRLWAVPPGTEVPGVPDGMLVVVADAATVGLLADLARVEAAEPSEEVERIAAREAFLRLPERPLRLPEGASPLRAPLTGEGITGEVAFAPGQDGGWTLDVLYRGRLLCTAAFDGPVPLAGVAAVAGDLDPADMDVTPALRKALRAAVEGAEMAVVERAVREPDGTGAAREVVLRALGGGLDDRVPELRAVPVFPTLAGDTVSADEISAWARVHYVTDDVAGLTVPAGDRTVRAVDPLVRAALKRFGNRRRNVTGPLREKAALARAREAHPEVGRLEVPGALRRAPVRGRGLTGEVALVPGEGRTLLVCGGGRRLGTEPLDVPEGVAAAIDGERLVPRRKGDGVARDRAYDEALVEVLAAIEAMAAGLAAEWARLAEDTRRALLPPFARLAVWVSGRHRDHPAAALPLLVDTHGQPLSAAALHEEHVARGHVLVAERPGRLLVEQRVWRPRRGEREAVPATWTLVDATEALARADELRNSAPLRSLAVPVPTRWREAVAAPGIEGEVAVPPEPTEQLVLELYRQRRLLERVVVGHPVGASARVDAESLRPDELGTRVERDGAFHAVRAAVDAALERALARMVSEGTRGDWGPHLRRLLRWKLGQDTPLASALLALPLFEHASGEPVTLGAVVARRTERGRVPVVDAGTEVPPGSRGFLLRVGPGHRALLDELGIPVADTTDDVQRDAKRRERREERRLARLAYEGEAVVRLGVATGGWKGEVALPHPPRDDAAVTLAREGIAVTPFRDGLGAAGVLEHAGLPVDPDWTEARLDEGARAFLRDRVRELFEQLADRGGALEPALRPSALAYVLRLLRREGVEGPEALDRVSGTADRLARLKLVETADGSWIDVRTVAAAALVAPVAVVPGPLDPAEVAGVVVLRVRPASAAWLPRLEAVLRPDRVQRHDRVDAWREEHALREPAPEDPVARGLLRLRRSADLLRADAFGRLGKAELAEVRVLRGDGAEPVVYDPKRRRVALDLGDPLVHRALAEAEARPDRVFALLAAIYGAVNRELEEVTDADEGRVSGALLDHLAANPHLLAPGEGGVP